MDWLIDRFLDVFPSPFQPVVWLEVGYDGSEFNQTSGPIGTGTSEISVDVFLIYWKSNSVSNLRVGSYATYRSLQIIPRRQQTGVVC